MFRLALVLLMPSTALAAPVDHVPTGHVALYRGTAFPVVIAMPQTFGRDTYRRGNGAHIAVKLPDGYLPCGDDCTAALRLYFANPAHAGLTFPQ